MRRLTITTVAPSCAVVGGYGSRELITDLRGRPPMWSSNPRGWVIQPSAIPDLAALAESRGYEVRVVEGEAVR